APVEPERAAAEVRMRDHEVLFARLEEGIVQRERHCAQEGASREDSDEVLGATPEREADSAPRRAAQPITPRADHGHWNQDEDEEGGGEGAHGVDHPVPGELAGRLQHRERNPKEETGLEDAVEEFPAGAVVGEPIALEAGLAHHVAAYLHPAPEAID